MSAEGAAQRNDARCMEYGGGPTGLKDVSDSSHHALTDVAIEYRPFGPDSRGEGKVVKP